MAGQLIYNSLEGKSEPRKDVRMELDKERRPVSHDDPTGTPYYLSFIALYVNLYKINLLRYKGIEPFHLNLIGPFSGLHNAAINAGAKSGCSVLHPNRYFVKPYIRKMVSTDVSSELRQILFRRLNTDNPTLLVNSFLEHEEVITDICTYINHAHPRAEKFYNDCALGNKPLSF